LFASCVELSIKKAEKTGLEGRKEVTDIEGGHARDKNQNSRLELAE
jgi:hypothetical protein